MIFQQGRHRLDRIFTLDNFRSGLLRLAGPLVEPPPQPTPCYQPDDQQDSEHRRGENEACRDR